jgi:GntR family transcriptional regulator/MocR family aminotransferase
MEAQEPPDRRVADAAPLLGALDSTSREPLHRQIYESIRDGILAGRFASGMRLPSTRVLAQELGVARNTVVLAYDQLGAEGYLLAGGGGGTRVRAAVPDSLISVHASRRSSHEPRERRAPNRAGAARTGAGARAARNGVATSAPSRPAIPARWARVLASNPALGSLPWSSHKRQIPRK